MCLSVKVFKTVQRKTQKTLPARSTTARDCLVLHFMSPMREEEVFDAGYCMILKSWNGLKRLVNKLQNVMFSNTSTDCMYSNSAAWARGARVQSPSARKICAKNIVTRHFLSNIFVIFLKTWQCDTCVKHLPKFVMRIILNICMLLSTKRSTDLPAGFCQNKI